MRFPRSARIVQGPLDALPWITVLFLVVIFLILSGLLYTPGVHVELPAADDLPGTDQPTIAVALDAQGRLYFANQITDEATLRQQLTARVKDSPEPLTLLLQADKDVTHERLVQIAQLARAAGLGRVVLATAQRKVAPAPAPANPSIAP